MSLYYRLIDSGNHTDLQKAVWRALLTIPTGETRTYKQIAIQIGRPGHMRAVAKTCGQKTPTPLTSPATVWLQRMGSAAIVVKAESDTS